MSPAACFDPAYRDKVAAAVYAALVEASRPPGADLAVIRNHEAADALLSLAALILSTSEEASSPTRIRRMTETIARDLRARISAARAGTTAVPAGAGASVH